jgi:hypothetical protein
MKPIDDIYRFPFEYMCSDVLTSQSSGHEGVDQRGCQVPRSQRRKKVKDPRNLRCGFTLRFLSNESGRKMIIC